MSFFSLPEQETGLFCGVRKTAALCDWCCDP